MPEKDGTTTEDIDDNTNDGDTSNQSGSSSTKVGGKTAEEWKASYNGLQASYQKLKERIKQARKIAVTDCICRLEARLLVEGCDHPIEICLSFGAAAESYIENGWAREITGVYFVNLWKSSS